MTKYERQISIVNGASIEKFVPELSGHAVREGLDQVVLCDRVLLDKKQLYEVIQELQNFEKDMRDPPVDPAPDPQAEEQKA